MVTKQEADKGSWTEYALVLLVMCYSDELVTIVTFIGYSDYNTLTYVHRS